MIPHPLSCYDDSHSALLEKEMGAALVELQALVQEGRTYIAKEVGDETEASTSTTTSTSFSTTFSFSHAFALSFSFLSSPLFLSPCCLNHHPHTLTPPSPPLAPSCLSLR